MTAWVRCLGDLDEHAVSTSLTLLSYSHAANAMVLAGHEFRDLRAALDWQWLQSLGDPPEHALGASSKSPLLCHRSLLGACFAITTVHNAMQR